MICPVQNSKIQGFIMAEFTKLITIIHMRLATCFSAFLQYRPGQAPMDALEYLLFFNVLVLT